MYIWWRRRSIKLLNLHFTFCKATSLTDGIMRAKLRLCFYSAVQVYFKLSKVCTRFPAQIHDLNVVSTHHDSQKKATWISAYLLSQIRKYSPNVVNALSSNSRTFANRGWFSLITEPEIFEKVARDYFPESCSSLLVANINIGLEVHLWIPLNTFANQTVQCAILFASFKYL